MSDNIFSFVKDHVTFADYMRLNYPKVVLHRQRDNVYRCSNIIAGGSNSSAMIMDDESGFFKCFSHGQESGDIITLHSILSGLTPGDAARDLADVMSLSLPDNLRTTLPQGGLGRSVFYRALDKITAWAHDFLCTSDDLPDEVLNYVRQRHVSGDIIDTWRIGFFPSHGMGDILHTILDKDEMRAAIAANVIKDDGTVPLRGRLIFPLINRHHHTIGYSGRIVPGVSHALDKAKYVNSPTSPVYRKSDFLMGEHIARRTNTIAVVCEGNFDVAALHAALGEDVNVFALCGTALTTAHMTILKNMREIVICTDNDDAGKSAALSYTWLYSHVPTVSIMSIPDGKDPWDSFCQNRERLVEAFAQREDYLPLVVSYAHSTMGGDAFRTFVSTFSTELTSFSDKNRLVAEVAHAAGVSVRDANAMMTGSTHYSTSHEQRSDVADALTGFILGCPITLKPWLSRRLTDDVCGMLVDNYRDYKKLIQGAFHPDDVDDTLYQQYTQLYTYVDEDSFESTLLATTFLHHILYALKITPVKLPVIYTTALSTLRRTRSAQYGDIMTLIDISSYISDTKM